MACAGCAQRKAALVKATVTAARVIQAALRTPAAAVARIRVELAARAR